MTFGDIKPGMKLFRERQVFLSEPIKYEVTVEDVTEVNEETVEITTNEHKIVVQKDKSKHTALDVFFFDTTSIN